MPETADNPFWDFSLAVYRRGGVAEACLALQDRHGLDVNLLLHCLWAGSRGRRFEAGEIAELSAAVGPWHEAVVKPLRGVRRWLKDQQYAPQGPAEALRQAIKARELEAEAIEQRILHERMAIPPAEGTPSCAGSNLASYLAATGVTPDSDDTACLAGCPVDGGGFNSSPFTGFRHRKRGWFRPRASIVPLRFDGGYRKST